MVKQKVWHGPTDYRIKLKGHLCNPSICVSELLHLLKIRYKNATYLMVSLLYLLACFSEMVPVGPRKAGGRKY